MAPWLWMSDIHLNFLDEAEIGTFLENVGQTPHAGLLVGGDIAECPNYGVLLRALAGVTDRPVYFVLGNHDAYHGSLAAARAEAAALDEEIPNLHWLSRLTVRPLTNDIGLIGHGCWGDGRNGDAGSSGVLLNDWILIDELRDLREEDLLPRLAALGAEGAEHLRQVLPEALDRYPHVVVLTHVPPFAGVNMRGAEPAGPELLPYYTCKAAGDVLRQAMVEHPHRRLTVLSGHTHGGGRYQILPNLTAWTLGTHYGAPVWRAAPLDEERRPAPDDRP